MNTVIFEKNVHSLDSFEELHSLMKGRYGDKLILTGSYALYYLLVSEGRSTILAGLDQPNDIDFVYWGDQINNPKMIGDYSTEYEQLVRSVTYKHNNKSFDLTFIPQRKRTSNTSPIKFVNINGINIIDPITLLSFYTDSKEEEDTDKYDKKINALKEFLKKI